MPRVKQHNAPTTGFGHKTVGLSWGLFGFGFCVNIPVDRILITFVYLGYRTHHMVGHRRHVAGRPVAATAAASAARAGVVAVHADRGGGGRVTHVR